MWEVWQGGECCHLPGSIQMKRKQDQSCGQICELKSFFHRRNKMTLMTLRCTSKFSLSSMRASRQKRPRMDLMEGGNSLLSPLSEIQSFQIFWWPDSVGSDLRPRDVRSARFFSLGDNLAFSLPAELSPILASWS